MTFNAIYVISLMIASAYGAPTPTENYANKLVLVEPDVYFLYWNYTDVDILFELHVKNLGWNAFGLSPTGGMANADVIVTWVNADGSVHFTDRHVTSDGRTVVVDTKQDWHPILIKQTQGYTVSKFTRKINICDASAEDLDIPNGTPFVIFSWNPQLTGNDISYHGQERRGQRTVPLISSLNLKVDLDQSKLESKEYRVNVISNLYSFYVILALFFIFILFYYINSKDHYRQC